jgi:ubiquinone/menaquinone biosynthesis C-methylase UbiE
MNWHARYTQQATWTRELRTYIFDKVRFKNARRVLEAGCGTGAVLSQLPEGPQIFGLDINAGALAECRLHAPEALLLQADAVQLPYQNQAFDLVYSHFLLLWVHNPLQALQEMKRVTRNEGYVIAFAEPDYSSRVDQPDELIRLGKWQTEALIRQGADPNIGMRLAELFYEAGIQIIETGTIQGQEKEPTAKEWELEWDVIEADLKGWVSDVDIEKMKRLDKEAWDEKRRVLSVPTYFAFGQI